LTKHLIKVMAESQGGVGEVGGGGGVNGSTHGDQGWGCGMGMRRVGRARRTGILAVSAQGAFSAMTEATFSRQAAWQILCEFVQSESLRKHALAVEACMASYARQLGEDEEKWRVTALLHDFDWEIHPDLERHPHLGEPILKERGVSDEIRRAILSHADYSGVTRESVLEKALYACDELSGFLTAMAYVKPTKSILEVEPASVLKKMKDKAFARTVNRDDIRNGAADFGLELEAHIANCIAAMRAEADALGLRGSWEG
jgi:putative nucleotidyltransferase with HDIG domain